MAKTKRLEVTAAVARTFNNQQLDDCQARFNVLEKRARNIMFSPMSMNGINLFYFSWWSFGNNVFILEMVLPGLADALRNGASWMLQWSVWLMFSAPYTETWEGGNKILKNYGSVQLQLPDGTKLGILFQSPKRLMNLQFLIIDKFNVFLCLEVESERKRNGVSVPLTLSPTRGGFRSPPPSENFNCT